MYVRKHISLALTAFTFQNIKHHRKVPCAMFLDEAPHIGVEDLPLAAANYRKHGIRLVLATQDLPMLEAAYPKGWRTLLGSAEVRIWLSNGEINTLKYMCEELGTCTVTEQVEGGWLSKGPKRVQRVERPLLYLDQARDYLDREVGNVIVTRTGKPPFRLKYDGYDHALGFWRFDALPQYPEPFLRAFVRRVVGWFWLQNPPHHAAGAESR